MQYIHLDKQIEKLKIGLFKKIQIILFWVPMIRYLERLEGKIRKCLFFFGLIFSSITVCLVYLCYWLTLKVNTDKKEKNNKPN